MGGTSTGVGGRTAEGIPRARRRARFLGLLGAVFRGGTASAAVGVLLLAVGLVTLFASNALPSIQRFGFGFLTSAQWDLRLNEFGAGPAVVGTFLTSALALLFAVPVGLGVALFSSEIAPRRLRLPLAYFVDLGAAIPSVVYGFWALEVLKPVMETTIEPRLASVTGGRFLFSGLPGGLDMLTASAILGIMVVPTIAAFSREALRLVPRQQRESALSLGATRWEATRMAVLGPAAPGIAGAIVLGLGRAIGETIAVALVIGGAYRVPTSLLSPGATIPSTLVNGFLGSYGLERSALFELCLLLLAISLAINVGARLLMHRIDPASRLASPTPAKKRRMRPVHHVARSLESPTLPPLAWWPSLAARQDARRLRRKVVHGIVVVLVVGAVVVAAYPLASVLVTVVGNGGAAVVRPSFYTSEFPAPCGLNQTACPIGGIGPAIQGTVVLLALAAAFGLPVGLLAGIYLSEYGRNRFGRAVGFAIDVLVGVPSILIGAFVFALFLQFDRFDARTALAGGVALGLLMIPIVAKATQTSLQTVPVALRDSALALGFPRHRVTVRVVLGNCRSALVTGNLLAVMRAGGEAAALLVTAGSSQYWLMSLRSPTAALAPFIFLALTNSSSPNLTTDAWGAALVLLLIMAGISLAARLVLRTESVPAPE